MEIIKSRQRQKQVQQSNSKSLSVRHQFWLRIIMPWLNHVLCCLWMFVCRHWWESESGFGHFEVFMVMAFFHVHSKGHEGWKTRPMWTLPHQMMQGRHTSSWVIMLTQLEGLARTNAETRKLEVPTFSSFISSLLRCQYIIPISNSCPTSISSCYLLSPLKNKVFAFSKVPTRSLENNVVDCELTEWQEDGSKCWRTKGLFKKVWFSQTVSCEWKTSPCSIESQSSTYYIF